MLGDGREVARGPFDEVAGRYARMTQLIGRVRVWHFSAVLFIKAMVCRRFRQMGVRLKVC